MYYSFDFALLIFLRGEAQSLSPESIKHDLCGASKQQPMGHTHHTLHPSYCGVVMCCMCRKGVIVYERQWSQRFVLSVCVEWRMIDCSTAQRQHRVSANIRNSVHGRMTRVRSGSLSFIHRTCNAHCTSARPMSCPLRRLA